MARFTKKVIEELAQKALSYGNPYINKAIKYQIDRVDHYIYAEKSMTRQEIDDAYLETARKDIRFGFTDRMVGYYDKWYRYTRTDEGGAYDMGVRYAADQPNCKGDFHIIECMH